MNRPTIAPIIAPTIAPTGRAYYLLLLALIAAEVTSAFEVGMLYSALSKLYGTFDDPVGVGWLITAFLLVGAASNALCGRLGDMLGRRRVMLVLLVFACIGSLVSALSATLPWIIFGRALQGVSAAILPLCIGLLRENLHKDKVPFGVGILSATAAVGAGIGLLSGGIIVDKFSWPWIFYLSGSMAAVSFLMVAAFVPASRGTGFDRKIDVLGGVLFVPAVAGILFGVTKGASWGWLDGRTLALMGGSLLLLAVWVVHELRHEQPLIDVRLFANRQIALTNVAMALFGLGASQLIQSMLMLLQQPDWTLIGFGVSATIAAAVKLPSMLLSMVASPWSGSIAAKRGARLAMLYATSTVACAWIGLAVYHGNIYFVVAMMSLATFGGAMMYSAMPNLLVESVPPERTSEAIGLLHVVRTTFTAIGAQMLALLLASSTVSDPARSAGTYPSAAAYQASFVAIVAVTLLAVVVTLCLPVRRPTAGAPAAAKLAA